MKQLAYAFFYRMPAFVSNDKKWGAFRRTLYANKHEKFDLLTLIFIRYACSSGPSGRLDFTIHCDRHKVDFLTTPIILFLYIHGTVRRYKFLFNTFAASYLNTQGLNNSCLKSPASTLVELAFQSRALRSFSLNQLRNLSL